MKRVFAAIFLILASCRLGAQDRRWDAALDQYQQICDECINLRVRSAAGDRIQSSSVTSLLTRLSSLRKTLLDAKGQMSPAQRLRFDSIRLRYEEVFGIKHNPLNLPALQAVSGRAEAFKQAMLVPLHPQIIDPGYIPSLVFTPYGSPSWSLFFFTGVPDLYYGTMLRLSFTGKPFGAYAKASVSIPYKVGAYECLSDGTVGSGYIWTSGKESVSRWAVTAGATISVSQNFAIYAGAGYGKRDVLWQDVSNKWATVSDLSMHGLVADGGIIVSVKRLNFMAGVSSFGFRAFSAEAGIGYQF